MDPVIGRFLSNDPVGFAEGGVGHFNGYWYADGNPVNNIDPDGRDTFVGTRPVFQSPQAREAAFFVGSRLGYVASRLSGNSHADARIQAAAIGGIAATASHSFGIVTPEGVSLADANISETQVFSFGPSGSPLNPGTTVATVAQPSGSPINRADRAATEQLIAGGGVGMQVNINGLSAGGTTVLSATEVTGVTNEQAIAAFSAPTSGQAYSAIPGANSSNSNTEIGNRVRSISPDFKKPDFPVTPGFE